MANTLNTVAGFIPLNGQILVKPIKTEAEAGAIRTEMDGSILHGEVITTPNDGHQSTVSGEELYVYRIIDEGDTAIYTQNTPVQVITLDGELHHVLLATSLLGKIEDQQNV